MKSLGVIISFLCIISLSAFALSNPPKGILKGKIIDVESKLPLEGVNILIKDTRIGTTTDTNGEFELNNLPVGSYCLVCSRIGYEKIAKTDVIVQSERVTNVTLGMKPSTIEISSETVTADYFAEVAAHPLSAINFSSEEIRRAPGAAGDVSKILFGLPSLAKINDTQNSLIVRGGSPIENGFYIDNIEIPNINHFPVQGSTEGPIGIINVDFINDVDFYSGGFSSSFGNKLSSAMDIKFRDGNRTTTDFQLDMSMQGFGGTLEGPINNGEGSYLVSARRSYLDLLMNMMGQKGFMPAYSDFQGKVALNLSPHHKITFLNITALDEETLTQSAARDNEMNQFLNYWFLTNTAGIDWQYIWGANGYSNTSISHTYAKTDVTYFQTRDAKLLLDNNSLEQEFKFRNINHWMINAEQKVNFGVDARYALNNYKQFFNTYEDLLGQKTDSARINNALNSLNAGVFVEYIWDISKSLTIMPGGRIDYYEVNKSVEFSPRFSITYHLSDITSLTGAVGIYHQSIPYVILAQKENFESLKTPRADHYILSFNHLLTENTKLTIEMYEKQYRNFPMDPSQSSQFLFDEAVVQSIFMSHTELVSEGKANSRGIEVTVQKKLAQNIYGLIAGSYSRSTYNGLDGTSYNRIYDNKFNFSVEGGYRPNESWEFSTRWIYAGGAPYTPFDEQASLLAHKGVYDQSKLNALRLPDFHSLNLRVDRRFHFQSTTLVTYLSIWNVYGRKNVAAYYWDEVNDIVRAEYMWGTLPVFGVKYEF